MGKIPFFKTAAWLIQVLLVSGGNNVMASSLRLPNPSELAGHWQLRQDQTVCELQLLEKDGQLAGDTRCAGQWLGETPVKWSPTPDGMWLWNSEGTGIAHLNRQQEDEFQLTTPSGISLVLKRVP